MDIVTEHGWDDAVAASTDMSYVPTNAAPHRLNATIMAGTIATSCKPAAAYPSPYCSLPLTLLQHHDSDSQ